jgi:hypothetical protein
MSDRDQWELRGPVRTLDVRRNWQEKGDHTIVDFRLDGATARRWHQNFDGTEWTTINMFDDGGRLIRTENRSPTGDVQIGLYEYDSAARLARFFTRYSTGGERTIDTYFYDADGLRTKTYFVDLAHQSSINNWGIEGSKVFYAAPNAARLTTAYNAAGLPTEVLFHDIHDALISRGDLIYDADGRLIEETHTLSRLPFPNIDDLPPEQRAAVQALLGGPASRRIHRYNESGLRIETLSSMFGSIGQRREHFAYNEQGDVISHISEHDSREYELSEQGALTDRPGHHDRSVAHFLYEYDSRGNWTSKITEAGHGDHPDFTVASTELRTLTYFDPI